MEPSRSALGSDHASAGREHEQISSTGEQTADTIKSAVAESRRVAEQQKQAGAERIGIAAQAMEGAADRLQGEMPQTSEFVHDLAQQLDSAAASLREKNIDELIRQARDFARRQPGMFFAGAVLSGVALARFLKSSPPQRPGSL
ncbi:MAG TPA: hypothetical protein VKW08_04630 [Xanthobacteraceae bacterium]|jgi:ABC-type transporter Mla subunit MlaD|nr:hypothetical protein [Xanthobacteraceae bacterium]